MLSEDDALNKLRLMYIGSRALCNLDEGGRPKDPDVLLDSVIPARVRAVCVDSVGARNSRMAQYVRRMIVQGAVIGMEIQSYITCSDIAQYRT